MFQCWFRERLNLAMCSTNAFNSAHCSIKQCTTETFATLLVYPRNYTTGPFSVTFPINDSPLLKQQRTISTRFYLSSHTNGSRPAGYCPDKCSTDNSMKLSSFLLNHILEVGVRVGMMSHCI